MDIFLTFIYGCILLIFILIIVNNVFKNQKIEVFMSEWRDAVRYNQYSHAYQESGMAIDTVNHTVTLMQRIDYGRQTLIKTYPFSQIREWSYTIPGADTVSQIGVWTVRDTLAVAEYNAQARKVARKNTGFIVRVRDIDYPEWFIQFGSSEKATTDMKRWMEVFTQYINEGA